MAAAAPSKEVASSAARQARRVRRDMSELYINVQDARKMVSYKGGWQNCTGKLQWFWFYFKKYGILGNFANCFHMREAWWESGEKRLVGMDAYGHRYWESDYIPRLSEGGFRWIDYPHHVGWADWAKLPEPWENWCNMKIGRTPNQWEQIHKELGPEWRDYMVRTNSQIHGSFAEEDEYTNPEYADGGSMRGPDVNNPWHPDFKRLRRWYGHSGINRHMSLHSYTTRNAYDIDETDSQDGAWHYLEYYKHMAPDRLGQQYTWRALNEEDNTATGLDGYRMDLANNFTRHEGYNDQGKWGSKMWWEYRLDQAERTRQSNEKVSAFDDPVYSSANTAAEGEFGYGSRYKENLTKRDRDDKWKMSDTDPETEPDQDRKYWREDPRKIGGASHGTAGVLRRW
eukprot:TRINITY_DN60004_c0_g1_i1.p2 TRINITY_DN60004_c0_g1~~TRINITY_DN60004_c0_g1_i1.p2  ORF type:complete len:398 (+),score=120.01 TRINITY_DN60004_c0_g1_i1:135-1328(+)